jgi:hypothetical protein
MSAQADLAELCMDSATWLGAEVRDVTLLLQRQDVGKAKRRFLLSEKRLLQGEEARMSLLGARRRLEEVAEMELELQSPDLDPLTRSSLEKEKERATAELELLQLVAARACAAEVAALEAGGDASSQALEASLAEMGLLAALSAKAAAHTVDRLVDLTRTSPSKETHAELQYAMEDLGHMSALVSKAKFAQATSLKAQLASPQISQQHRLELEEALGVTEAELGAYSAEGAKWLAQECRRLKDAIRKGDTEDKVQDALLRGEKELGLLSEEGSTWLTTELGRLISQGGRGADVDQMTLDLRELDMFKSCWRVRLAEQALDGASSQEQAEEQEATLAEQVRHLGRAGAVVSVAKQTQASEHSTGRVLRELQEASLHAARWKLAEIHGLEQQLLLAEQAESELDLTKDVSDVGPSDTQQLRSELEGAYSELSDYGVHAVAEREWICSLLEQALAEPTLGPDRRASLEQELEATREELGEMARESARSKRQAITELEALLALPSSTIEDRGQFEAEASEASRQLGELSTKAAVCLSRQTGILRARLRDGRLGEEERLDLQVSFSLSLFLSLSLSFFFLSLSLSLSLSLFLSRSLLL